MRLPSDFLLAGLPPACVRTRSQRSEGRFQR
jgi:hypothetical protein